LYEVFDSSLFVRGSINVKDFQQFFKLLDIKSRISCIILVNEFSSSSAIDERKGFDSFISVFPLICIGIDNEFDSILAVLTLKISRQGETDVEAVLLFKNPALPILSKIRLFLHHSFLSTDFECVDEVLFHYIYLTSVFVSMCWLNQDNLFQDVPVFHNQSTILSACIPHVVQAVIQLISIAFGFFLVKVKCLELLSGFFCSFFCSVFCLLFLQLLEVLLGELWTT